VLNSKGANVEAVYLKNYKSYDNFAKQKKDALCLFKSEDASNFIVIPGVMSTENIVFDVIKNKDSFDFVYSSNNKKITVSYDIKDDYRLSYNLAFEGFSALEMDKIRLKWKMNFKRTERKIKEQRRITTICFEQKKEGLDYLSETSDDYAEATDDIEWVAFKQSYFSSILHPKNGFKKEDGRFLIKNYTDGEKHQFTTLKK